MKKLACLYFVALFLIQSYSKGQNLDLGLVARYDFSGNANDLSGNNNNATVNGALLTIDRFNVANRAYSFDGVNDYIAAGNIIDLSTQNAITITGWFRNGNISGPINRWVGLLFGKKISGNLGIRVTDENSYEINVIQHGSPGGGVYSDTSFSLNTWYFVVAVFSSSQPELYIDLISQSKNKQPGGSLASMPSTAEFHIGKSYVWNSSFTEHYYHGELDDIRIYNRVLDTCEMKVLFDGDTAKPVITKNNNVLTSTQASSYQWFRNDTLIVGATAASITITQNGRYSVIVPILDGCYTRTGVYEEWLGLQEIYSKDLKVKISPNPSQDHCTLTFDNKHNDNVEFQLFDQFGRMILNSSSISASIEINSGDLSQGLYYYTITIEEVSNSGKFVVKK